MRGDNRLRNAALLVAGGVLVGIAAVRAPIVLVAALIFAVWALAKPWVKLTLIIVCAFLPFTVGSVGSIPNLKVIELLAPVSAIYALSEVAAKGRDILPRRVRPYLVAIVAMLGVATWHMLVNGVGSTLGALGSTSTGLRAHYDVLLAPVTFLGVLWMSELVDLEADAEKILNAVLGVAIVAGLLRIANYYAGVPLPFLAGTFSYGVESRLVAGGTADRIGGLAEASGLGLSVVLAYWLTRRRHTWLWAASILLALFAVLSGGRTFIVGAALVLLFVPVALRARVSARQLLGTLAGIAFAAIAAVALGLGQQFSRLTAFAGGLAEQDPARLLVVQYLWAEFLKSPLIGKGIGVAGNGIVDEFVAAQVQAGGHSSYLSAFANFGIVGGVYLLLFLLGPSLDGIARLRSVAREGDGLRGAIPELMVFACAALLLLGVQYITGGDGYSDMSPFAMAGLALGAIVLLAPKGVSA